MKEKLFNRNFTLLLLGQVFSLIGNYTLKFALSMYVLERTGSGGHFCRASGQWPRCRRCSLRPSGGCSRTG